MDFIDSHCHIHSKDYRLDGASVYQRALDQHVTKMICVGTDQADSVLAIDFAQQHANAWAAVGVHPHEAQYGASDVEKLAEKQKVVAIGEIGLDYFYHHSSPGRQRELLELQIDLALRKKLPIIFHVREAFDDFWPIFDSFYAQATKIRGVIHSFSDAQINVDKALARGLYIGVNGISTFTKDSHQQTVYKNVPLEKIVLETDAPYLTPTPHRGKVNEPLYVRHVGEHLAGLKNCSLQDIAVATTANATDLFRF